MFPSQMLILMAVAVSKDAGKELLTRPMDVIGEYIGYLYDSLVSRGYLKGNRSRGYHITPIGRRVLLESLCRNEARAKYMIIRLRKLGIGIGKEAERKIGKLEKEAIRVN
ncbi:hypothetical protein ES703_123623 [subsurface metagenome]